MHNVQNQLTLEIAAALGNHVGHVYQTKSALWELVQPFIPRPIAGLLDVTTVWSAFKHAEQKLLSVRRYLPVGVVVLMVFPASAARDTLESHAIRTPNALTWLKRL
jgi:hypothetical protein